MAFTAKDVQALRQATGAGMMDAKRPSRPTTATSRRPSSGCVSRAWPPAPSATTGRTPRASWRWSSTDGVGAMVELKSETDFVAGSEHFKLEAQELAHLVAAKGVDAVGERQDRLEDLKITLKEKIEVGRVVRLEAEPGDR